MILDAYVGVIKSFVYNQNPNQSSIIWDKWQNEPLCFLATLTQNLASPELWESVRNIDNIQYQHCYAIRSGMVAR